MFDILEERYRNSSNYSGSFCVAGKVLCVKACDKIIFDSLCSAMSGWDAADETENCERLFADYAAIVPDIRRIMDESERRIIDDPAIGKGFYFNVCGYSVFYMTGLGYLIRSENGFLSILIENTAEHFMCGQMLNMLSFAHIAVSDVLYRSGKMLVHAAASSNRGVCCIWTGESGAGKSTAVLRAAQAGWSFFGDDMVVIGKKDGRWTVWPYRRPLKVTAETCSIIGFLNGFYEDAVHKGKTVIDPASLPINSTVMPEYIDAVFALNLGSEFRRSPESEAFGILSKTFMYFFWQGYAESMLESVMDFCFSVPVYNLGREKVNDIITGKYSELLGMAEE